MKNGITMALKKGTIVLIMAISSISAYEIEVVNCRSALRNDPPPSDKILDKTYNDMWSNPDDFVCAYHPCDFSHTEGWFAIKKDRTMVFHWEKKEDTTITIYYDDTTNGLIRISFNKYGVGKATGYDDKVYSMLIDDILLAGVKRCSN